MAATGTSEAPTALSDRWRAALVALDADLRRRAAAEKTRRAYGSDVEQFALWCSARSLEPAAVEVRELRRFAATLSEGGIKATSVARKIASLRALYRVLREHGEVAQNPAELMTLPKRPRTLPHVLRAAELAALLERIGASTALELRDRAMFELAYASGLRAEELVDVTVAAIDFDGEQVRVEGKGSKTRFVPVGEPALAAISRYL
jgi:site-specific recombinase XerD